MDIVLKIVRLIPLCHNDLTNRYTLIHAAVRFSTLQRNIKKILGFNICDLSGLLYYQCMS